MDTWFRLQLLGLVFFAFAFVTAFYYIRSVMNAPPRPELQTAWDLIEFAKSANIRKRMLATLNYDLSDSIKNQLCDVGMGALDDADPGESMPNPPPASDKVALDEWLSIYGKNGSIRQRIEDVTRVVATVSRLFPTSIETVSDDFFRPARECLDYALIEIAVLSAKSPDGLTPSYCYSMLNQILEIKVPFSIPDEHRDEHMWILGSTGTGKTTTMKNFINSDLPEVWKGNRSVVIIESKGDLFQSMMELKFKDPSKVTILDVEDIDYPLALNLFAIGKNRLGEYSALEKERLTNSIIELYEYVLSSLMDASMTSKQSVVFRYITRLMLLIPDATLHTMADLLEANGSQKYQKSIEQLVGTPRRFFDNEFDDRQFQSTRKEVLRRLYGVLENQSFARMFGSAENKFDLFDEMNEGRLILINASKTLLKDDASQMFVRFIIAMLSQATQERSTIPEAQRTRTHVYIDEAHEFLDQKSETILAQARAFNVGLTVANQYIAQLTPALQASFSANVNTKLSGYASAADAAKISSWLQCEPDTLMSLKKGEFVVWQKEEFPQGILLKFPADPFKGIPKATPEEIEGLKDMNRLRVASKTAETAPTAIVPKPSEEIVPLENETQDWEK